MNLTKQLKEFAYKLENIFNSTSDLKNLQLYFGNSIENKENIVNPEIKMSFNYIGNDVDIFKKLLHDAVLSASLESNIISTHRIENGYKYITTTKENSIAINNIVFLPNQVLKQMTDALNQTTQVIPEVKEFEENLKDIREFTKRKFK